MDHKEEQEQLDTLEVKRTADWDGKTAMFIQYKVPDKESKESKERKEVVWYEKNEKSGFWRRAFVDLSKVRRTDKKLAEDIDAWSGSRWRVWNAARPRLTPNRVEGVSRLPGERAVEIERGRD